MRPDSAASQKGTRRGAPRQKRPREDSRIGKLYDRLKTDPAYPVTFEGIGTAEEVHGLVEQLRNFYGLDIRCVKKHYAGYHAPEKRHPSVYMLVGEYDGPNYIDYVAQRVEKEGPAWLPDILVKV